MLSKCVLILKDSPPSTWIILICTFLFLVFFKDCIVYLILMYCIGLIVAFLWIFKQSFIMVINYILWSWKDEEYQEMSNICLYQHGSKYKCKKNWNLCGTFMFNDFLYIILLYYLYIRICFVFRLSIKLQESMPFISIVQF